MHISRYRRQYHQNPKLLNHWSHFAHHCIRSPHDRSVTSEHSRIPRLCAILLISQPTHVRHVFRTVESAPPFPKVWTPHALGRFPVDPDGGSVNIRPRFCEVAGCIGLRACLQCISEGHKRVKSDKFGIDPCSATGSSRRREEVLKRQGAWTFQGSSRPAEIAKFWKLGPRMFLPPVMKFGLF